MKSAWFDACIAERDRNKTPSGRDRAKIKAYNDARTISEIGTCSVCGASGVKIWVQCSRRCVSCHRAWRRIRKGLPAVALTALESDLANFWKRVKKGTQPDDCWIWIGAQMDDGYGRMYSRHFRDEHMRAHRFSFFIFHERLPTPFGLHRCDTPLCVNPDHIFEGDAAANVADCIGKGRFRNGVCYGEKNNKSKLTVEKVIEIRRLYAQGMILSDLGKMFGVNLTSIHHVVTRKTWKHFSSLAVKP